MIMNNIRTTYSFEHPADDLLAGIAIANELSPHQRRTAEQRYEALGRHIERDDSPLTGRVHKLYPQGSMAINAAIQSRRREEGHDVDIVVELVLDPLPPAREVLHLLYDAIRGEPGSRYYRTTQLQSRCVTVCYADNMHIDFTPACRLPESAPRESLIFHSKQGEQPADGQYIVMNSYGFADHFSARMAQLPQHSHAFVDAYSHLVRSADLYRARGDADVEEIPDQIPVESKSPQLVALQLLKSNRNLKYREVKSSRRQPPSVMLSALALEVKVAEPTLSQALRTLALHIVDRMKSAQAADQLIEVRNPVCPEDCFTDRWPEDLTDQHRYIRHLQKFLLLLDRLTQPDQSVKEQFELLKEMFGGQSAQLVVDSYTARLAEVEQQKIPANKIRPAQVGGLAIPATVSLPTSPSAHPNTFYGSGRK